MSGDGTERCENRECCDCGNSLDTRLDDHFVLTEEPRPIPDGEDMEFDDWFRTNWILCPDCVPDIAHSQQTATEDQEAGSGD